MRIANIINLGFKEFRSLGRDPVMLFLILYAFTLAVYTSATAIPETLNKAPIAIVDEDFSPLSSRITGAFYPPYFLPPYMVSQEQMDAGMDAGLYTFGLNIPPGFQKDLLSGHVSPAQLNVDATRMSQAFTGSGYVQSIITQEVQKFLGSYRSGNNQEVDLVLRARFNPELNKSWFGAIMEVINNITMLSIVLTGAALIREREHGTVEHLLVMPITPFEIMASKVWSMIVVVLTASVFSLFVIVKGLLAIPTQGSMLLFMAAAALHLFATASLGIFLGTVARSMPQFGLLLMLVLMPIQMLSGGATPRENMPEFIQNIMLIAPDTHFIMIAQGILFRGAGFYTVWPQFIAIAVIGVVLFVLTLARFRKTISTMM